jgi:putative ABC transport system ATP-binding protein
MTILRTVALVKRYRIGSQTIEALRGVDLNIEAGEFTAIAGPSGSGKSTLLNLIGCMDSPTSGEIYVGGEPAHALSERGLTELRLRRLGFVFQSFNLVPVLSVYENVELPLLLQGGVAGEERRRRVDALIAAVGLEKLAKHKPAELSGGQQQRVAIARALITKPAFVLADEPTANLDSATGSQIIELMKQIRREANTTFIFSTHDPSVMAKADRVVRLRDGHIASEPAVNTPAPVAEG